VRSFAAWTMAASSGMLLFSEGLATLDLLPRYLASFALGLMSYAAFRFILWGSK
jgi:hypothetical protein